MKYTIITVNYNNCEGLRQTVQSVISQTYKDVEYIVIDGGSTDGSVEVLKQYEKYFSYWVSEKDKGIYNAMNKGIKHAHGDYLNFMNSGDMFFSNTVLEDVLCYLGDDIVHGKQYDRSRGNYPFLISQVPTMAYFYESSLQHQSCFIRRELFKDSLYDENYRIVSDWKFFIEKIIFQNCSFSFIPVTVASFEGNGVSIQQRELDANERQDVLNHYLPPRVLQDYERFKGKESPVLDLIPEFNRTYRLQNLIVNTIKIILKAYKILKPRKK